MRGVRPSGKTRAVVSGMAARWQTSVAGKGSTADGLPEWKPVKLQSWRNRHRSRATRNGRRASGALRDQARSPSAAACDERFV